MASADALARIRGIDPHEVAAALRRDGYATTKAILPAAECARLIKIYGKDDAFRARVDMARHSFGVGDYAYFARPLPAVVAGLRDALYKGLAPIANQMMVDLGRALRYPPTLAAFQRRCKTAGQTKPTPLLLRYQAGGYNRLHRDLYGELAFPLQATVLLSRPETDFSGGEFLLVENRPREQAIANVVALSRGQMVVFPVSDRPVQGKRGHVRASVRHGVSALHAGERYALGIIFHDAK